MIDKKRTQVEKLILETVKLMEPTGTNYDRYKKIFSAMTDTQFDKFMKDIKNRKRTLSFFMPNMQVVLKQEDLMNAAEYVKAEVFTQVTLTDPITGLKYTTPQKNLVLLLPVRRTRQFLQHGLSVPESDSKTDLLTGQVIKPDQASRFSFVEMYLLYGRNMDKTIVEFMKIRGGDLEAYASFKRQLEETGEFSQESLDTNTVTRTAMVSSLILKCMGLDNNLVEHGPTVETRQ